VTNDAVVYVSRRGDDSVTVVLNVGDTGCTVPAASVVRVLEGAAELTGDGGAATATVAAHGWAVLGG
jgi:hypothetical protein